MKKILVFAIYAILLAPCGGALANDDVDFEKKVRDFMMLRETPDRALSKRVYVTDVKKLLESNPAYVVAINEGKKFLGIGGEDNKKGSDDDKIKFNYIAFDSGAALRLYQPDFKRTENSVVEYITDPTINTSVQLSGILLNGKPTIYWKREWNFEKDFDQKETIVAQQTKIPTAFKSIQYGLDVEGATSHWIKKYSDLKKHRALAVITSLKVGHSESQFHGSAKALKSSVLIKNGASINNNVISGNLTAFDAGESLGFKTEFSTWKGGINILAGSEPVGGLNRINVSYFQTDYRRPTSHSSRHIPLFSCPSCGAGSRYYVFDADFQSKGVSFDFEGKIPSKIDGLNITYGAGLDLGVQNKIVLHDTSIKLHNDKLTYIGYGGTIRMSYAKEFDLMFKVQSEFAVEVGYHGASWSTQYNPSVDVDQQESLKLEAKFKF